MYKETLCLMRHYYYLIPAGCQLEANTPFYLVGIGNSKQCAADMRFLEESAAHHKWYFHRVCPDADAFIQKLADSLTPSSDKNSLLLLNWYRCTSREAVKLIKQQLISCVQVNLSRTQSRTLEYLSLNYRASMRAST